MANVWLDFVSAKIAFFHQAGRDADIKERRRRHPVRLSQRLHRGNQRVIFAQHIICQQTSSDSLFRDPGAITAAYRPDRRANLPPYRCAVAGYADGSRPGVFNLDVA